MHFLCRTTIIADGLIYRNIIDGAFGPECFCEENHEFHDRATSRYIKIVFTGETSALNCVSRSHEQIFGSAAISQIRD